VTTRSTSYRGYTWDRESTLMSPDDIKERLSFVEDTVVTVERHGKEHEFFLKRDDVIWILPDPQMLPAREGDITPKDLPDEDWWAAKILDVGLLRQDDGDPMAVLKVSSVRPGVCRTTRVLTELPSPVIGRLVLRCRSYQIHQLNPQGGSCKAAQVSLWPTRGMLAVCYRISRLAGT
jgi:hypothetical protein